MSNSVPPQQEYLPGVRWGVSCGDSASLSIIWLTVRVGFDWRWHTWRNCGSISSASHLAPAFSSMSLCRRWERQQEMLDRKWHGLESNSYRPCKICNTFYERGGWFMNSYDPPFKSSASYIWVWISHLIKSYLSMTLIFNICTLTVRSVYVIII